MCGLKFGESINLFLEHPAVIMLQYLDKKRVLIYC
jgi:hypothetical protein